MRDLWPIILEVPRITELYPIPMQEGDTYNLTQTITTDVGHLKNFIMHVQLKPTCTMTLLRSGTIAIGERFFFFNPDGPEDTELYEYIPGPAPTANPNVPVSI